MLCLVLLCYVNYFCYNISLKRSHIRYLWPIRFYLSGNVIRKTFLVLFFPLVTSLKVERFFARLNLTCFILQFLCDKVWRTRIQARCVLFSIQRFIASYYPSFLVPPSLDQRLVFLNNLLFLSGFLELTSLKIEKSFFRFVFNLFFYELLYTCVNISPLV